MLLLYYGGSEGFSLPPPSHPPSSPRYLLARDEDYENAFHSSADFLNMHALYTGHSLSNGATSVILFDRNPDGPFYEMIQEAFSKNHPLKRAGDFGTRKVTFDKLVFHLESPAAIVHPKAGNLGLECHDSLL